MLHATYDVTTEPTTEPLTLEEFKERLRVGSNDFDSELNDILVAARKQVENDSHRKLITQTVKLYLDRFPVGTELEIRLAPITAIASVKYVDVDDATQTFSSSLYQTDLDSTPPRIWLVENEDWPDTADQTVKAVTVEMTAGYGAAASVPAEAKLAMVEWGRAAWGGCDDMKAMSTYAKLMSTLRWAEYHKVV